MGRQPALLSCVQLQHVHTPAAPWAVSVPQQWKRPPFLDGKPVFQITCRWVQLMLMANTTNMPALLMPAGLCFGWVSRTSAVTQQPDLSLSMENWFLFGPCVENWLPAPQYLHAPAWRVPVHGLVVVQQLICWEPCFEWDTRWCGRLWPERKEVSGGKGHQEPAVWSDGCTSKFFQNQDEKKSIFFFKIIFSSRSWWW